MAYNVWDNALGFNSPSLSYEGWLIQQQLAQKVADEAAAKQKATATAVTTPTATATPATTAAATTTASAFDASPFKSIVDTGFSQFTPEFYANQYASSYDPYKTGLESLYGSAKDTLTAGLAKKGLSNSQQGKGVFQQLDALKNQAETTGQQAAQNYQTTLSNSVQAAKDALYGSIAEGDTTEGITAETKAAADPLYASTAPAQTLGDIFGNLVQPYATAASPGGPVNPNAKAFATGDQLSLAGSGPEASTKVVGKKKKF